MIDRNIFLVFFFLLTSNHFSPLLGQQRVKVKGAILTAQNKSLRKVELDIFKVSEDQKLEFQIHKQIKLLKNSMFEFSLDKGCTYAFRFYKNQYYTTPSIIYLPSSSSTDDQVMLNVFLEPKNLIKQHFIIKSEEGQDISKETTVRVLNKISNEKLYLKLDSLNPILLEPAIDYEFEFSHSSHSSKKTELKISEDDNTPIEVSLKSRSEKLRLKEFFFAVNKWELQLDRVYELTKLIDQLLENPSLNVQIVCHEDARGDDDYNLWLSTKRAEAVSSYLIKKGITANRIIAFGKGEQELVNECSNGIRCSNEKHKENQRIEIELFLP